MNTNLKAKKKKDKKIGTVWLSLNSRPGSQCRWKSSTEDFQSQETATEQVHTSGGQLAPCVFSVCSFTAYCITCACERVWIAFPAGPPLLLSIPHTAILSKLALTKTTTTTKNPVSHVWTSIRLCSLMLASLVKHRQQPSWGLKPWQILFAMLSEFWWADKQDENPRLTASGGCWLFLVSGLIGPSFLASSSDCCLSYNTLQKSWVPWKCKANAIEKKKILEQNETN